MRPTMTTAMSSITPIARQCFAALKEHGWA
jgi:hypothetical protein